MRAALTTLCLLLAPVAWADDPTDRVTLDLEDFLKLYEGARDKPTPPGKPAYDATMSVVTWQADVRADAAGEPITAVLKASVRVDRHGTGWARIPLLSADTALISATLDGRPAPLALRDGWYELVTQRTGTLDLTLETAVVVTTTQGVSAFAFPVQPAGTSTLTVTLPDAEPAELTIARARVLSDAVSGGRRQVRAAFVADGQLAVRWQRAATTLTQAPEQPRVYADVHTLVGLGDGLLRATAVVRHTILFAGVDTFRYQLPPGMTVLDVRGSGLRDWRLGDDGTLTLSLAYAAENATAFTFELEQAIGAGDRGVDAPLVTPLGVERTKGYLGVTAGGGLEVAPGAVQVAVPVDVRTLPADVLAATSQPVLLGYKYLGADARVPLQVTEHDQVDVLVTLLDRADATTMITEDGRRLTQVRYLVRNNRRQYLRLTLPDGAELWSAAVAGTAVQPSRGADGAILLPLVRSADDGGALASFPVEVVYVETDAPPDNGTLHVEAALPRADAPTTWLGWTLWAPERAKVPKASVDGSLRHVPWLSRPADGAEVLVVEQAQRATRDSASGQIAGGALGNGATPVRVELPLEGQALSFEKLLALDERLWVGFDLKGLR